VGLVNNAETASCTSSDAIPDMRDALATDDEHELDDIGRPDRRRRQRRKARIAALIRQIPGLRPIDAGRLETSRITEQLTALTIGINIRHKATAGIKLTGLPAAGSFAD
jgi:hypothetical protein